MFFCLVLIQLITKPFSSGVFAGKNNERVDKIVMTQPTKSDASEDGTLLESHQEPIYAARLCYCGPNWYVNPDGKGEDEVREKQNRVNHGIAIFNPIAMALPFSSLIGALPSMPWLNPYLIPYASMFHAGAGIVSGGACLLSCGISCFKSCGKQLNENKEAQKILFGDL